MSADVANQIQHKRAILAGRYTQGATDLLQVHGLALRRPRQQHCLHSGNIDAFTDESAVRDDFDFAGGEGLDDAPTLIGGSR